MNRVVVVNGPARSGKDSFVNFVTKYYSGGPCIRHSTIDSSKQAAKVFGADEKIKKTDKERRLWSDLKKAYIRYNDGPLVEVIKLANEMESTFVKKNPLVFVIVREPEEITKIKSFFRGKCITVLVEAPTRVPHMPDNKSDQSVYDFRYDYSFKNDKDIHYLEDEARWFAKHLDTCEAILPRRYEAILPGHEDLQETPPQAIQSKKVEPKVYPATTEEIIFNLSAMQLFKQGFRCLFKQFNWTKK